jgi:hypothetical protein
LDGHQYQQHAISSFSLVIKLLLFALEYRASWRYTNLVDKKQQLLQKKLLISNEGAKLPPIFGFCDGSVQFFTAIQAKLVPEPTFNRQKSPTVGTPPSHKRIDQMSEYTGEGYRHAHSGKSTV